MPISGCGASELLKSGAAAKLAVDHDSYSPVYDELFAEVGARLKREHLASKLDLGALVFWKHINNARWMTELMLVPEATVKVLG
jgi:hypothetical protein